MDVPPVEIAFHGTEVGYAIGAEADSGHRPNAIMGLDCVFCKDGSRVNGLEARAKAYTLYTDGLAFGESKMFPPGLIGITKL